MTKWPQKREVTDSLHNTMNIINHERTVSNIPIVTTDKQTIPNMVVNNEMQKGEEEAERGDGRSGEVGTQNKSVTCYHMRGRHPG